MRRRLIIGGLISIWLSIMLGATAFAQTTTPASSPSPAASPAPTPDAAAVLAQASAAATRADDVAKLVDRTMTAIQWIAPFFGLALGLLVWLGFDVRRGTRALQQEYKVLLDEARQEYQDAKNQTEAMQTKIKEQVEEIERIRQNAAQGFKRFEDSAQALVLRGFGDRLFVEGKRREAIDAYLEARSLHPHDATINYSLGRAYSNVGSYDQAIKALVRALDTQPDMPEANMELGLAYRRRGQQASSSVDRQVDYLQAERYFQRAIELRPNYGDALATLGGLYRREGKFKEALEQYQLAFKGDPNSSYGLGNLASLLWRNGQIEQARLYFGRTAQVATRRIEDGQAFVYWDLFDRALARLALQQDGAREDHVQALALTPSAVNLEGVLDNLQMLKSASTPIEGLDEFIALVEKRIEELTKG
jgi:tetratricopeptide (TPR) repeat protein